MTLSGGGGALNCTHWIFQAHDLRMWQSGRLFYYYYYYIHMCFYENASRVYFYNVCTLMIHAHICDSCIFLYCRLHFHKRLKFSLIKTEKVKIPILSMHCLLEKTSSLTFQFYVSDHTLFREIRIANLNLINAHVAYQFLKKKKLKKAHHGSLSFVIILMKLT